MTVKHWTHDPHCDTCPTIETIDHIILRCKPADNLGNKLGLSREANSSQNMLQFMEQTLIGAIGLTIFVKSGQFALQPVLIRYGL